MWFSYVVSPLGSNMRIRKKFLLSIEEEAYIPSLECKEVNVSLSNVAEIGEDYMDLIYIDPDVADLIKLGIRKFTIANIT